MYKRWFILKTDSKEIVAIPLKINRAIFQAQVFNMQNCVNAKSPLPKTIQIFLDKA